MLIFLAVLLCFNEAFSRTSVAAAETERMTDTIRNKIIDMHNRYRSMLAQGQVRNGKEGSPNCPKATNMYRMRYDMAMEKEAQLYADSCPDKGSDVSTRPYSGENTEIDPSTTISYLDAVVNALETWWTQVSNSGVNKHMKYTEYLATKDNAPTKFTQMAWAATYKVGCGLNRCNYGTIVVCRYSPRGNIHTQYIYRIGNVCALCADSCVNGLCSAPAR
ncbi:hypothetical protein Y032_0010g1026 [Ancylostoma ceylanicum]|uniref:SCP domain-containing protein n=1 Tax=Ancylostoma ceylanicum TaxID=53326 RepID=A0A016VG00_9BILA|nr:hypothetical protein Y032_0010g1026 [Ancylostoma ceylanicum]